MGAVRVSRWLAGKMATQANTFALKPSAFLRKIKRLSTPLNIRVVAPACGKTGSPRAEIPILISLALDAATVNVIMVKLREIARRIALAPN